MDPKPFSAGEHPHRLPKRAVRVLTPDDASGVAGETFSVYCPRREHMTPVADCERCSRRLKTEGPGAGAEAGAIVCFPGVEDLSTLVGAGLDDGPAAYTALGSVVLPVSVALRRDVDAVWAQALIPDEAHGLPVVDTAGKLVGLFAKDTARVPIARTPVERWMKPPAPVLFEDDSIAFGMGALAKRKCRVLFLVSKEQTFVGTVRDLDLLRWFSNHTNHGAPLGSV